MINSVLKPVYLIGNTICATALPRTIACRVTLSNVDLLTTECQTFSGISSPTVLSAAHVRIKIHQQI